MMYEIKPNEQFKSLEIYFTEKPEAATRDALKALRFRWNPKKIMLVWLRRSRHTLGNSRKRNRQEAGRKRGCNS